MQKTPKTAAKMVLSPASKAKLDGLKKAELMPEMRKALTTATNGAVPAVRNEVRKMPSHRTGRRPKESLRSQVAMAIKRRMSVSKKSMFVAIISEPHGGLANLARCVEGEIKWWHPTFGNVPIQIQKPYPFFYHTLDKLIPGTELRVREALIRFERRIP